MSPRMTALNRNFGMWRLVGRRQAETSCSSRDINLKVLHQNSANPKFVFPPLMMFFAAVVLAQNRPSCFAKSSDACDSLRWSAAHNRTCCLVPSPPGWMDAEDAERCMGLGLGCPSPWSSWITNGYDPTGKGFGVCFCNDPAGICGAGTIEPC